MAKRKRKTGQPNLIGAMVEVVWRDTTGHAGWHSIHEALTKDITILYTVGYVLEQTPDVLKLVRSVEHPKERSESVGDVFIIPTEWVQNVRTLR